MSKQTKLYSPIGQVRLAESDVLVTGKTHFKAGEKVNNRNAELHFDAWVDDISESEKEVFFFVSFSFSGSRRRESFWIRDVFSLRITLFPNAAGEYPQREEYDYRATLDLICRIEPGQEGPYNDEPFIIHTVFSQLDMHNLTSHKDTFDRQMTQVLTHDLENAFKLWHDDEKNGFLGMEEMTAEEAVEYLPKVFTNASIPKLTKKDYQEMLEGANRVLLCEVSPEGYGYSIFKRMRYAVDSLGHDSKDVIYYAEVGKKSDGYLTPDSADIVNNMERHFNVVKHIWGINPDGETRYTRAYVGLIIRDAGTFR